MKPPSPWKWWEVAFLVASMLYFAAFGAYCCRHPREVAAAVVRMGG